MSKLLEDFMKNLKTDNVLEAMDVIKNELSSRSREIVKEMSFEIAEKLHMHKANVDSDDSDDEEKEDESDKEEDEKSEGE